MKKTNAAQPEVKPLTFNTDENYLVRFEVTPTALLVGGMGVPGATGSIGNCGRDFFWRGTGTPVSVRDSLSR